MPTPKITLAMGGGGSRGLAHLGVYEFLSEQGLEFDRLVGISIGSLIGGLIAFESDHNTLRTKALSYLLSQDFQKHQATLFGAKSTQSDDQAGGLFSWYSQIQEYLRYGGILHRVITQPSMLPGIILNDVIDHLLENKDISAAKIPLSIVAADLQSGQVVVLEKGPLREAVKGSSALPGVFPPVDFAGMKLCDTGNFLTLPTMIAQSYAPEFLLAIDVSNEVKPLYQFHNAFDAVVRMNEVGENYWRKQSRPDADMVIRPQVGHIEWFNFSDPMHLIELGREAAKSALPELLRLLETKTQGE
jgi:NTE family protein